MARTAYFDGYSYGTVNTPAKTQVVTFNCSWADNSATDDHVRIGFLVGLTNPPSGTVYWYDTSSGRSPGYWRDWPNTGPEGCAYDGGAVGVLQRGYPLECDRTYYANARVVYWLDYDETSYNSRTSATTSLKTYAIEAVVGSVSCGSITDTSMIVGATYYINTYESTGVATCQYKRTVDSVWLTAATSATQSGYGAQTFDFSLTGLASDTQYDFRVQVVRNTVNATTQTGATTQFTTLPGNPVFTADSASAVSHDRGTGNTTVDPNDKASSVYMEYGLTGAYGTAVYVGYYTGTTAQAVAKEITGLASSTLYYFRFRADYSGGSVYSAGSSFTTSVAPPTPDITTGGSSSVTHNSATIAGTVNPNLVSTQYYFQYGTTVAYGTDTALQGPSSAGAPFGYTQAISGLTASTTYHYRAVALYSGVYYYGSDATFTTAATPDAVAAQEDHLTIFEFNERKKNAATSLYFAVASPAATSSNRLFNDASPFAAGDVQVSIDGGAFANVGTLPTRVGTTPIFKLDLAAGETNGDVIVVTVVDATVDPAFRDCVLIVRTKIDVNTIDTQSHVTVAGNLAIGGNHAVTGNLSAVNLALSGDLSIGDDLIVTDDVTIGGDLAITGNLSAAAIVGYLTSMVIRKNTVAGGGASTITLDASAAATDDFYNEAIVMVIHASGRVQSRTITNYVGSTKVATVNRGWIIENPAASDIFIIFPGADVWDQPEKAGVSAGHGGEPSNTDYSDDMSMRRTLQFIKRRMFNKATMTTLAQVLYKDDSTTTLLSRAVGDSSGTQYQNKVS